ncbi:MAG: hypothetical protein LAT64_08745 [Phycisphaerales bacterium]|nr:hypothetical protein [Planctomycetota bacterium]MCH8508837.1 hypothetical protein [Phycisphaerales bacterium]
MSADQTKTRARADDLEAAIDALLAEINETCSRFENPPPEQNEDEDLEEYTRAVKASVKPSAPPPAEPNEAEAAIDEAGQSADELLEQAADELIESLEAEVERAAPEETPDEAEPADAARETETETETADAAEPSPKAEPQSGDDLLESALDELLGEEDPDAKPEQDSESPENEAPPAAAAAKAAPDVAPDADTGEPDSAPVPEAAADEPDDDDADAMVDLDAAFDALLDGTFETADGQTTDTEGVDTTPDPSLMLDKDEQPEPEPIADTVSEPAVAAPTKPNRAPAAAASAPAAPPPPVESRPVPATPGTASDPWHRVAMLRMRAAAGWARPRLGVAFEGFLKAARPAGARALLALSKPLEGKPTRVRDSLGWIAIWTMFLAVCVWLMMLMRSPEPLAADPNASRVVTTETVPAD